MGRKNEAYWVEKKQYWKIQVQKDGERKSFYSSTSGKKGKAEVEGRASKWLDEEDDYKSVRLNVAWGEYLEQIELLKGTGTYKQTESIGRVWILPILTKKIVSNISDYDWQRCINEAYKEGRAKKTLNNIRSRIYNFCKFAKKARYLKEMPFDLEVPDDAYVAERGILQPDALKVLFIEDTESFYRKIQPAHNIHAFRFIVALGLRRGELCGLKNSDIKDGVLTVQRAYNQHGEFTKGKNKNAKRRIVLNNIMLSILENQKIMLKEKGIISPFIFPDEQGDVTNPDHFTKSWMRFKRTHSLTCDVQGLRRTMVSVIKADMPVELAKRVVGHSMDMDTYGIYGREVDGELERASEILGEVFDKLLNS